MKPHVRERSFYSLGNKPESQRIQVTLPVSLQTYQGFWYVIEHPFG